MRVISPPPSPLLPLLPLLPLFTRFLLPPLLRHVFSFTYSLSAVEFATFATMHLLSPERVTAHSSIVHACIVIRLINLLAPSLLLLLLLLLVPPITSSLSHSSILSRVTVVLISCNHFQIMSSMFIKELTYYSRWMDSLSHSAQTAASFTSPKQFPFTSASVKLK